MKSICQAMIRKCSVQALSHHLGRRLDILIRLADGVDLERPFAVPADLQGVLGDVELGLALDVSVAEPGWEDAHPALMIGGDRLAVGGIPPLDRPGLVGRAGDLDRMDREIGRGTGPCSTRRARIARAHSATLGVGSAAGPSPASRAVAR